jgi:hypothetical protein
VVPFQIPEEGTGMADEQNYKSYLLTFEEAMNNLWETEGLVLSYAWAVFINTEDQFQAQIQASEPSTTGNSSSQGMSSTLLHLAVPMILITPS